MTGLGSNSRPLERLHHGAGLISWLDPNCLIHRWYYCRDLFNMQNYSGSYTLETQEFGIHWDSLVQYCVKLTFETCSFLSSLNKNTYVGPDMCPNGLIWLKSYLSLLVALLNLSSWCLVMVERLFLAIPRGCLRFVIVVFPDHTHLLFLLVKFSQNTGYIIDFRIWTVLLLF